MELGFKLRTVCQNPKSTIFQHNTLPVGTSGMMAKGKVDVFSKCLSPRKLLLGRLVSLGFVAQTLLKLLCENRGWENRKCFFYQLLPSQACLRWNCRLFYFKLRNRGVGSDGFVGERFAVEYVESLLCHVSRFIFLKDSLLHSNRLPQRLGFGFR